MSKLRSLMTVFLLLLLTGCSGTPEAPAPAAAAVPAVAVTAAPDPAVLGESLLAEGRYGEAIDALSRALEQNPADATRVRALLAAYERAEAEQAGAYTGERVLAYETLLRMDAATDADTLALFALYGRTGRSYEACRLLERSQLLAQSEEKRQLLDALVIDAASLDGGALETVTQLEALLAQGNTDAAAAVLLDDAAYAQLASDIPDMTRRYRLDAADGGVLRTELTRLLPGQEKFTVWYQAADGRTAYLCRDRGTLSVVTAQWRDGAYNGAFEALFLDAGTGSVFTDAGTLTGNVWTGDATATAAFGTAATALPALWETRTAVPPVSYTGSFDAAGHATAKQQTGVDGIVYAYTEDEKAYLYLTVDSTADAYAFGVSDLALEPVPAW